MASSKAEPGFFTILYFASAGSYTKKDSETIKAPLPLKDLFALLEERYAGIKQKVLESCMVTVNLDYVEIPQENTGDTLVIGEGDEVCLLPPVSSGWY